MDRMYEASRRTVLAALACAALGGCVSPWSVETYEPPGARVAARDTFFVAGGELGTPSMIDPELRARVDASVRAVLAAELARKGYAPAAAPQGAGMLVSYQVAGQRRLVPSEERRIGAPSPNDVLSPSAVQPPPLSELPRDHLVREGTVILLAEDPAGGGLLWRGLVRAEMRAGSPEESVRAVTDMFRQIALEFPARGAQPAK